MSAQLGDISSCNSPDSNILKLKNTPMVSQTHRSDIKGPMIFFEEMQQSQQPRNNYKKGLTIKIGHLFDFHQLDSQPQFQLQSQQQLPQYPSQHPSYPCAHHDHLVQLLRTKQQIIQDLQAQTAMLKELLQNKSDQMLQMIINTELMIRRTTQNRSANDLQYTKYNTDSEMKNQIRTKSQMKTKSQNRVKSQHRTKSQLKQINIMMQKQVKRSEKRCMELEKELQRYRQHHTDSTSTKLKENVIKSHRQPLKSRENNLNLHQQHTFTTSTHCNTSEKKKKPKNSNNNNLPTTNHRMSHKFLVRQKLTS